MLRLTLSVAFLIIVSSISSFGDLPPADQIGESPSLNSSWSNVEVFALESKPGAEYTIYLDFDGHTTTGTVWNDRYGNSLVTDKCSLITGTDAKTKSAVGEIWARVAEDYAPFNVNVTTKQPEGDVVKNGVRICIGEDNSWYPNEVGGVANIGSFNDANKTPAFVFAKNLDYNVKYIAEAISHEAGHTFGLNERGLGDGTINDINSPNAKYYYGDKDGVWAPIMGAGYLNDITQWSDGNYPTPPGTTPSRPNGGVGDLEIISSGRKGIGYREDDYADNRPNSASDYINGTAETLGKTIGELIEDPSLKKFFKTGTIETNTDVDVFHFALEAGESFLFNVISGIWKAGDGWVFTDANLDVLVKLFLGNSTENLLENLGNPFDNMGIGSDIDQILLDDLEPGEYFLTLEGTGLDGYYSKYASLGTYAINGEIVKSMGNPPDYATPEPTTSIMLGLGLVGLALTRRRK